MKWWERLNQLQKHRWLPFFLPVIGTLLYIAIAVLLIPSEFGDKADNDGSESEKGSVDVSHAPKTPGRTTRNKRLSAPAASAVPATSGNP